MKIGLTRLDYPETRCIKTSALYNYKDLRNNNLYGYCKRIPVIKSMVDDFLYTPIFNINVDIYHAFNYICITKKNWVVTYETMVPRFLEIFNDIESHTYSAKVESYLLKLTQKNCLALLPISECTKKIQETILKNYPDVKDEILKKTTVLYPPQKVICTESDLEKKKNKKIKFLFVGNDFFRKGGGEVIEAFEKLFSKGILDPDSVEVTLIGDINKKYNYALGEFQHDDAYFNEIDSKLRKCPSIEIINNLDNDSVIKLMKGADVGLLATWADTFGYSVLEFQASGCPVISTNVRALPEINNDHVGWIIDVAKDELGNIKISSYQDVINTKHKIISGIMEAVLDACNNKSMLNAKGIASIKRIREFHDITRYNETLSRIYNREFFI